MGVPSAKELELQNQLRAERLSHVVDCVIDNYNWIPLAEAYFQIKSMDGVIVPFRANRLQHAICRDRMMGKRRVKRLKVRRHGSTVGELLPAVAYMLVFPNYNVIAASDDIPSAGRIVQQNLRPLIQNLHPDALSLVDNIELVQRELRITHRRNLGVSTMFVGGLDGDESLGLGIDVNYLIVTEGAYIGTKGWTTINNIVESLPPDDALVTVESTANGIDNDFYELYVGDKWHRQFFPWWTREDAWLPPGEVNAERGLPQELWGDFQLNDREREWVDKYGLTIDHIRFYRWKQLENGDLVKQYFPSTAEEAFISSSRVTFPLEPLESAYNLAPPVLRPLDSELVTWTRIGWSSNQLVDDLEDAIWQGLKVWRRPESGHTYTIGVDTGEGKVGSDLTVCQVVNNFTGEQVSMLRGYYRPDEIASMVVALADYFNQAFIVPEKNGIGAAVCQLLEFTYHYDNCYRPLPDKPVGYNMTRDRKMELFGKVSKALESYSLKVNDRTTIREMRRFHVQKGGLLAASDGSHDDCVMALMLAYDRRADGFTAPHPRKRTGAYAIA